MCHNEWPLRRVVSATQINNLWIFTGDGVCRPLSTNSCFDTAVIATHGELNITVKPIFQKAAGAHSHSERCKVPAALAKSRQGILGWGQQRWEQVNSYGFSYVSNRLPTFVQMTKRQPSQVPGEVDFDAHRLSVKAMRHTIMPQIKSAWG